MKIPVPLGDVVDKATILALKVIRIGDPVRAAHAREELAALKRAWAAEDLPPMDTLPAHARLADVNAELWEVEDLLRQHEARGDFGPEFVELARSVYKLNDQRAAHKRAINEQLGSDLVEVKSYSAY